MDEIIKQVSKSVIKESEKEFLKAIDELYDKQRLILNEAFPDGEIGDRHFYKTAKLWHIHNEKGLRLIISEIKHSFEVGSMEFTFNYKIIDQS